MSLISINLTQAYVYHPLNIHDYIKGTSTILGMRISLSQDLQFYMPIIILCENLFWNIDFFFFMKYDGLWWVWEKESSILEYIFSWLLVKLQTCECKNNFPPLPDGCQLLPKTLKYRFIVCFSVLLWTRLFMQSLILIFFYLYSVVPWAPGGSKFTRNPIPPAGVSSLLKIVHVFLFVKCFRS